MLRLHDVPRTLRLALAPEHRSGNLNYRPPVPTQSLQEVGMVVQREEAVRLAADDDDALPVAT